MCFFFFKQKTAYEMRISDWSSDVCSSDLSAKPLAFTDAPRGSPVGEPGSTPGGTGIGISVRCAMTPTLLAHLRWLMSDDAQRGFLPAHDGQPSRRPAWTDPAGHPRWGNFQRNTPPTTNAHQGPPPPPP